MSSGFFVRHSQQVGEPNGLALVNGQANLLQVKHRHSPGLEIADPRIKRYPAFFLRSYHKKSFMSLFSKIKI
ncbi:hypothetical protein D1AOALGA4SA_561 [Olavius algarvensis Delta 1 endosymbiont]|nr:hypothetical protein D1AOALGA4SA_561 [Olavius algarvensis Delta 1 endosymbiont]